MRFVVRKLLEQVGLQKWVDQKLAGERVGIVRKNERGLPYSSFRCRFEEEVGASVSTVRGCYHDLHCLPVAHVYYA